MDDIYSDEQLFRELLSVTRNAECVQKVRILMTQQSNVRELTRAGVMGLLMHKRAQVAPRIFRPISVVDTAIKVIAAITRTFAQNGCADVIYYTAPQGGRGDVDAGLKTYCKSDWDAIQAVRAQAAQLAQQRVQQA